MHPRQASHRPVVDVFFQAAGLLVLFRVFGRTDAELADEIRTEIRLRAEADSLGDLVNLHVALQQELGSPFEAGDADEIVGCHGGDFPDLAVQGGSAEMHVFGDLVDIQIRIADMLEDDAVQLLEELLVRLGIGNRLHVGHRRFEVELADMLAVGQQVGDLGQEQAGRERLVDIGIGTRFQSFHMRLDGGLGRQQDDGNMAELHVCLDLLE